MKIYGVTGWKNAGKTTLMERLVQEFVARRFKVSTVKHAHHDTDVDQEGRDSYRHRTAGAQEVMLASPKRWALMHELRGDAEPPLSELLARMTTVDLILVEGYKSEAHPKIEAYRSVSVKAPLAETNPTIRAIASDCPVETDLPLLDLNDTSRIADFISEELGL